MKLRHALAGTVALPLALAMSSAQAVTFQATDNTTVGVGGFVQLQYIAQLNDEADDANAISADTSRFNLTTATQTDAGEVRTLLEYDSWQGPNNDGAVGFRLRHAAVMWNGWTAGQFWNVQSVFAGGAETLDFVGITGGANPLSRTGVVQKTLDLGEGQSLTFGIQNGGEDDSVVPDYGVRYNGSFGAATVGAAFAMVGSGDDTIWDMNAGAHMQLSDMTRVGANFRMIEDRAIIFAANAQQKLSDQLRVNVVFHHAETDDDWTAADPSLNTTGAAGQNGIGSLVRADDSFTQVFVNAIYTLPNGVEVGGEFQTRIFDEDDVTDNTFIANVKYAF